MLTRNLAPNVMGLYLSLVTLGLAQSQEPRVTPLGTQLGTPTIGVVQAEVSPDSKKKDVVVEDLTVALAKAIDAHGGQAAWASIQDYTAVGKLTFFAVQGEKSTVDVALVRKVNARIQRVIKRSDGELRQGSDGSAGWESFRMTVPVREDSSPALSADGRSRTLWTERDHHSFRAGWVPRGRS
jgi:hypothetical protein